MARDSKGRFSRIYADSNIPLSLKIPKEKHLNRKLNQIEIEKIIYLYSQGNSSRFLGKEFNVSKNTILYWIKGPEFRKSESKRKALTKHKPPSPYQKKQYRERLKQIIPNLNIIEALRLRKQRLKFKR